MTDRELDALTALLLDPCLTVGEAEREASAAPRHPFPPAQSARPAGSEPARARRAAREAPAAAVAWSGRP